MATKNESEKKEKPAWIQMIGYCYHWVPWLIGAVTITMVVKIIAGTMRPLF